MLVLIRTYYSVLECSRVLLSSFEVRSFGQIYGSTSMALSLDLFWISAFMVMEMEAELLNLFSSVEFHLDWLIFIGNSYGFNDWGTWNGTWKHFWRSLKFEQSHQLGWLGFEVFEGKNNVWITTFFFCGNVVSRHCDTKRT